MYNSTVTPIKNSHAHLPPHLHQFLSDVIEGLQQTTKSLPPKYFYDTNGSHYFDSICDLPEYYLYRTELTLLPSVALQLQSIIPDCTSVIEFGAGSLKKIQFLLDNLTTVNEFIPIDIAKDFLEAQCALLEKQYPHISVNPISGDFSKPLALPKLEDKSVLGFFPGSTIGNFNPEDALHFLSNAGITLGDDSYLLIGVDTKKSPQVLHRAYNDENNMTAKFNLNLLTRINRELNGNFNINAFEHYAFYNAVKSRIEMHLVSKKKQTATISGTPIKFAQGESIHTECSYKYNPNEFQSLAEGAGWRTLHTWLSSDEYFAIYLLNRGESLS